MLSSGSHTVVWSWRAYEIGRDASARGGALYCENCGYPNESSAVYCERCGSALNVPE